MSTQSEGEIGCTYCPVGTMKEGTTTDVYERGGVTLVVKDIPAQVCWACGESLVEEEVVEQLEKMLTEAEGAGVESEVRRYTQNVPA